MIHLKLGASPATAAEYHLPTSLAELPLRTYIALSAAKTTDPVQVLHLLCGAPEDLLRRMPRREAAWVLHQVAQMLSEPVPDLGAVRELTLQGTTYPIPASLAELDFGRWVDAEDFMRRHAVNEAAFYPYLLAIFCVNPDQDYTLQEIEARAELFRDLDVLTALKVNAFFLTNDPEYLRTFRAFFPSPTLLTFRQALESSITAGEASSSFDRSRERTTSSGPSSESAPS